MVSKAAGLRRDGEKILMCINNEAGFIIEKHVKCVMNKIKAIK